MNWREKLLLEILLIVAKVVAPETWRTDLERLRTKIYIAKPDEN